MDSFLTDVDVRILGALIEKQITTPDNYPLSMNALILACNQSSNRTPVVAYNEEIVLEGIVHLRRQSLVRAIQHAGSRVTKYEHRADDELNLTTKETAVMCVLMLRGPNTVAEIRTRTERLAPFESLLDVENVLNALIERTQEPMAVRLPRQPGQKEVRYAHTLSGEVTYTAAEASVTPSSGTADRVAALEEEMSALRTEMADLRTQFAEFRKQFE